jgi:hypothetical protein
LVGLLHPDSEDFRWHSYGGFVARSLQYAIDFRDQDFSDRIGQLKIEQVRSVTRMGLWLLMVPDFAHNHSVGFVGPDSLSKLFHIHGFWWIPFRYRYAAQHPV